MEWKDEAKMVSRGTVYLAALLLAPGFASAQNAFCVEMLKHIVTVETYNSDSSQYSQNLSSIKKAWSETRQENAFKQRIEDSGLSGGYKMLELAYENQTGKSSSTSSIEEIVSSVDQTSFSEFVSNNASQSVKKDLASEAIGALESCAKSEIFSLRGNVSDKNSISLKARYNAPTALPIENVYVSPEGSATCTSANGLAVGSSDVDIVCNRKTSDRITITLRLKGAGLQRSVIAPKFTSECPPRVVSGIVSVNAVRNMVDLHEIGTWRSGQVFLDRGDQLVISASGRACWGDNHCSDPDGYVHPSHGPLTCGEIAAGKKSTTDEPLCGSLVAKVGGGAPFSVGRSQTVLGRAGEVSFGFYDIGVDGNSGSYDVNYTVRRALSGACN